jgi:hypothetical protein
MIFDFSICNIRQTSPPCVFALRVCEGGKGDDIVAELKIV